MNTKELNTNITRKIESIKNLIDNNRNEESIKDLSFYLRLTNEVEKTIETSTDKETILDSLNIIEASLLMYILNKNKEKNIRINKLNKQIKKTRELLKIEEENYKHLDLSIIRSKVINNVNRMKEIVNKCAIDFLSSNSTILSLKQENARLLEEIKDSNELIDELESYEDRRLEFLTSSVEKLSTKNKSREDRLKYREDKLEELSEYIDKLKIKLDSKLDLLKSINKMTNTNKN